jgi:hypothetical protein
MSRDTRELCPELRHPHPLLTRSNVKIQASGIFRLGFR